MSLFRGYPGRFTATRIVEYIPANDISPKELHLKNEIWTAKPSKRMAACQARTPAETSASAYDGQGLDLEEDAKACPFEALRQYLPLLPVY